MLVHIVMWRLNDPADAPELKRRLDSLNGRVPSLRKLEVGINVVTADTASDVVLYSEFDDLAGLKAYAEHPDHLVVVDYVKSVARERRAVDYQR